MVVQEKLTQREEYQMPMGMTSDENDHESGLEELDKMGFEHFSNYRPMNGLVPFGINMLADLESDDVARTGQIDSIKMRCEATNPVVVMAEVWESHMQIAMLSALRALAEMLKEMLDKGGGQSAIEKFHHMMTDEDDKSGVQRQFLQTIYRTCPDVISIGNPYILNNVIAGVQKEGDFSNEVENFLKKVVMDEEE